MKYIISFLVIASVLIMSSCRKDEVDLKSHLVLLKVDYLTYKLEGGMMFDLNKAPTSSQVQFTVENDPSSNFSYLKLYHVPDSLLVFDGLIIWNGSGNLIFPDSLNPASSFNILEGNHKALDTSRVHQISSTAYNQSIDKTALILNEISDLQIVQNAYNQNFDFSILCYTPSIGIGNPSEWDYFVYFYVHG